MSSRSKPPVKIKAPSKAQSEIANKQASTEKTTRANVAALLSSDDDDSDGNAPTKKAAQPAAKPKSLKEISAARRTLRDSTVSKGALSSSSNIDKSATSGTKPKRPKGRIDPKTLERVDDYTARFEERAKGFKKYDRSRTSIGADGITKMPSARKDSAFKDPSAMFGDIQTDLKDVAERTKRKQPRWKDPMEQFGGLVKDVESKARKAKASGWKDPSVMFDDIQVPSSPAFSSQADPLFKTIKRKRDKKEDVDIVYESSSSLSSAPSDLSEESIRPTKQSRKEAKKPTKKEEKPKCPICDKELSVKFYNSWGSAVHKMDKQIEMHESHQRMDMEKEAVSNKYPAVHVDWEKVKKRCSKHIKHLKEVIDGKCDSPFRKNLSSKMRKGVITSPGYYGPRGGAVFMEEILRVLRNHLTQAGQSDRTVATVGVTAFTQYVLVPELGIRLIMEDLKVNSDEAAKVMSKTVEMGERLNPEEEDDLLEDGDEEGEGWMAV